MMTEKRKQTYREINNLTYKQLKLVLPYEDTVRTLNALTKQKCKDTLATVNKLTGKKYAIRTPDPHKYQVFDMHNDDPNALPTLVLKASSSSVLLKRMEHYFESVLTNSTIHV